MSVDWRSGDLSVRVDNWDIYWTADDIARAMDVLALLEGIEEEEVEWLECDEEIVFGD